MKAQASRSGGARVRERASASSARPERVEGRWQAVGVRPGGTFKEDVITDLQKTPKELQSKYLYDALGSSLFEAICRLPWYQITRAELRLLRQQAASIVAALRDPVTIVELGCGSGEKVAVLVEALNARRRPARVHLIDISARALEQSERAIGGGEHVSVVGHRSTYEDGLRQAATVREPGGTMMALLLGSNLGNFDAPAADTFLSAIRRSLRPGDAFLLGADLVKPEADLVAAYDDPLGLTAAFNRNLLVRINRELGGGFDLRAFDHRAIWNADARRVEMHLVSRRRQRVRIAVAGVTVRFEPGETIWTESSYKYEPGEIIELGSRASFRARNQWVDPAARFALTLFEAG
jgi:dimethylhistidine N-methyltransferase